MALLQGRWYRATLTPTMSSDPDDALWCRERDRRWKCARFRGGERVDRRRRGHAMSATREERGEKATELKVAHFTADERAAKGKAARAEVPRASHSTLELTGRDPVALLEEQATTRVPELVPIRYGRMLVSPFTFYRGAAKIMAHDLAATPDSGIRVQLCGDAHLSNFGVYNAPDRRLVFDINDFDETLPGPWEWDVKRLAASMLIAARDNGFGVKDQDRIVLDTVGAYRTAMREFAGVTNLDVWYARLEIESVLKKFS